MFAPINANWNRINHFKCITSTRCELLSYVNRLHTSNDTPLFEHRVTLKRDLVVVKTRFV